MIAETMFRSGDIERWGSGIKRIHDECAEYGIKVEFIRRKTGFVVSFYRPESAEEKENIEISTQKSNQKSDQKSDQKTDQKINSSEDEILTLMRENRKTTISQISLEINKGITVTKELVRKLKHQGKIKRIGPDKGGYWQVINI